MAGFTNRGKYLIFNSYFRNTGTPTNFYIALVTSATAPTADTNWLNDLTEITAGNGYTSGGSGLARNSTFFDTLTEDDGADRALVQLKDITWTAAGGTLPLSGNGARYAVLTDDVAVSPTGRQVIAYWDLGSDVSVSNTQSLTLQNCELRGNES